MNLERINNLPLATKLLLTLLVAAILPQLIGSGIITQFLQRNALQSGGEAQLIPEAQNASALVAQFFAGQVMALETLSLNEELQDSLVEHNASYGEGADEQVILDTILRQDQLWVEGGDAARLLIASTISADERVNPTAHALSLFQGLFIEHVEVFVTDKYGATVASTGLLSDYYQADEVWWQSAYAGGAGAIYIGDPEFDDSANANALKISIPVYNDSGSEIIGVLRTTLNITTIEGFLDNFGIGETGQTFIINNSGSILITPNPENTTLPAELNAVFDNDTADDDIEGYVLDNNYLGEPSAFAYTPISFVDQSAIAGHDMLRQAFDDFSWRIVVSQAQSELIAPVRTTQWVTLGLIALAALIGLIVGYFLIQLFLEQLNRFYPVFAAIDKEQFDTRVEVITEDELGQIAGNLNTALDRVTSLVQTGEEKDAIQNSIMKLLDEVSTVADGDLTAQAEVSADMTGAIADSFNFMIEQLHDIISNVRDTSLQVSASANEIQTTAEHLSFGSESQAERIVNTTAAIDEMSVSINQVSENSTLSATVGEQARVNAQKGSEAVQKTINEMMRIREQVETTSTRIQRLGTRSKEIGDILKLIRDIADRTSILALNASIQAAMAGDAGRGFAVVAEEVERLAEQSNEATRDIETLIRSIQDETTEAVHAMEVTAREVDKGTDLALEAGSALEEIEAVSNRLAELIRSISLAAQQQARGSETIARAMNDIAEVTQQTASGTKQATVSIGNLAQLADELRDSVSAFRLATSSKQANNDDFQWVYDAAMAAQPTD